MNFEIVMKYSNFVVKSFEAGNWREGEVLFDAFLDKYVNPLYYSNFILDTKE